MIKTIQSGEGEPAVRERLVQLGALARGEAGPLILPAYAVEDVPADPEDGRIIFCMDGDDGGPCLAVSSGGDWLRIALGAAVAEGA
jgi:hypothetical protein